jgi:hypothetical protein
MDVDIAPIAYRKFMAIHGIPITIYKMLYVETLGEGLNLSANGTKKTLSFGRGHFENHENGSRLIWVKT